MIKDPTHDTQVCAADGTGAALGNRRATRFGGRSLDHLLWWRLSRCDAVSGRTAGRGLSRDHPGILSSHLRAKGVAGLVCDGAVRDVGTLGSWTDFPVFSRWITPRGPSGADRGAVNLPVTIGGVPVAPGDLMIGDDDGLVVLSPKNARALIGEAEAKLAREAVWIEGLAAGKSAADVFGLKAAIRG